MTSLLDQIIAATASRNVQDVESVRPMETPVSAPVAVTRPVEPSQPPRIDTSRNGATAGDFVHQNQVMDSRFRNVSTGWTNRLNDKADYSVMTYDDARDWLSRERGSVADIVAPLSRFRPAVRPATADDGTVSHRFAVEDSETGRCYGMTESALGQYLMRTVESDTSIGQYGARRLAEFHPDILVDYLSRETAADKSVFVRTRGDSIRAFLSDQYAVIDNRWFLDVLESIIPGGLVSHSRGDGDSVYFNVLIPDSLRMEADSEYGGMLACGNSEIGARRLSSLPSVFRAICMNGCIWGEREGVAFVRKVHRGEVDLQELRESIRVNLNAQIPLLNSGINKMLALRDTETAIDAKAVLAAAIWETQRQVSRTQADSMLLSYAVEAQSGRTTAFDVVQGVTRAAQSFQPAEQETAERFAGNMLEWQPADWNRVFSKAESFGEKELKRVYQTA